HQVDHPDGNGENGIVLNNIQFTVTDSTGDTAQGTLTLTIVDDVPLIAVNHETEHAPLVVDESFIPAIGSQQDPTGSNVASASFGGDFIASPGADGGATEFTLVLNSSTTNLVDSVSGQAVVLVLASNTEVDGVVTIDGLPT